MSDAPELGPESLLSPGDGETAATLHDRLDLALRYIANFYKATADSDNKAVWWGKIDAVRVKVETAEHALDPSLVFPGNHEIALYNDAAADFPSLWRELYLSPDTLPHRDLLAVAADVFDTIVETPGYIVTRLADSAGRALGNSAKSFFLQAWPFLLAAGVGLAAYAFRRPLGRLLFAGAK
jgi:hypothetical protein